MTSVLNAETARSAPNRGQFAPASSAWQPNTFYKAGQLVTQGGVTYTANADFTSGAVFNATNWTATTGAAGVGLQHYTTAELRLEDLVDGATDGLSKALLAEIRRYDEATKPADAPVTALGAPTGVVATGSTTGGTIPAGTYYYSVTAINDVGETIASAESSVVLTGTTSSVSVAFTPVAGARVYRLWRGTTAGSPDRHANIATLTASPAVDTGSSYITARPPKIDTTGRTGTSATAFANTGQPWTDAKYVAFLNPNPVNGVPGEGDQLDTRYFRNDGFPLEARGFPSAVTGRGINDSRGAPVKLTFVHRAASRIAVDMVGLGQVSFRWTVDGRPVTVPAGGVSQGKSGAFNTVGVPASGATGWTSTLTLPDEKPHVITVETGSGMFAGLWLEENADIRPPEGDRGPSVGFYGDSFTEGTGATVGALESWADVCAESLGYNVRFVNGSGGTGYVTTNGARVALKDRIATDALVPGIRPDLVVFAMGINDGAQAPATVQTAAGTAMDNIINNLPDSTLVVLGAWWPADSTGYLSDSNRTAVNDAIRTAALARNLLFIDPIREGWVTGTGRSSAPNGTGTGLGKADFVTSSDGTHPTTYGHKYLGLRVAAVLRRYGLDATHIADGRQSSPRLDRIEARALLAIRRRFHGAGAIINVLGDEYVGDALTGDVGLNYAGVLSTKGLRPGYAKRVAGAGVATLLSNLGSALGGGLRHHARPSYLVLAAGLADTAAALDAVPAKVIADYRTLIERCLDAGVTPVPMTLPPHSSSSTRRQDNIRLSAAIRSLAAQYGLPCADAFAKLVNWGSGNYAAGLSDDGVLPNPAGQAAIGQAIADALDPLLPPRPVGLLPWSGSPNLLGDMRFNTNGFSDGLTGALHTGVALIETDGTATGVTVAQANTAGYTFSLVAQAGGELLDPTAQWQRVTSAGTDPRPLRLTAGFINSAPGTVGQMAPWERFAAAAMVRSAITGVGYYDLRIVNEAFPSGLPVVARNLVAPATPQVGSYAQRSGLSRSIAAKAVYAEGEDLSGAAITKLYWTVGPGAGTYDLAIPSLINLTTAGLVR